MFKILSIYTIHASQSRATHSREATSALRLSVTIPSKKSVGDVVDIAGCAVLGTVESLGG